VSLGSPTQGYVTDCLLGDITTVSSPKQCHVTECLLGDFTRFCPTYQEVGLTSGLSTRQLAQSKFSTDLNMAQLIEVITLSQMEDRKKVENIYAWQLFWTEELLTVNKHTFAAIVKPVLSSHPRKAQKVAA